MASGETAIDKNPPRRAAEPPKLDGIVLHDAWLCCRIFFAAGVVDILFKSLFVPYVGPPQWAAWFVEQVLTLVMIFFLLAAFANAGFSVYFHFRKRIKAKK